MRQLARVIYRTIMPLLRPRSVTVDGHRIYLDRTDSLRLVRNGCFEPYMPSIFSEFICPGMTVLDLGAHIGYHTLTFARRVGDVGHVYAYEALPANAALLRRNVDANSYRNVTVANKAVSDRTGTALLHLHHDSKKHSLFRGGRRAIEVETVRLDEVFAERRIDFIKMDIEGAEPLALQGMRRILTENSSIVLVTEFSGENITEAGGNPAAYLDALSDLGFSFQRAKDREPLTKQQLLDLYGEGPGKYTNLVCRRLR